MARFNPPRWLHLAAAGAAALCLEVQAAAEADPQRPPLDVRVEAGRLSVDIVGAVPLADVLEAIAAQTGAELRLRGEPGDVRPQAFTAKPLADGIRQLVEPNGVAMTFEPTPDPGDAPRLSSLTVYAATAPSPVDGATGSIRGPAAAGAERARDGLPSLWDFGRAGDDSVIAALAEALVRDPDALTREGVGASLGVPEGPEDHDAVRDALASGDPRERIAALWAIGARGGDGAVGPLIGVLTGDEDPEVRRAAVEILAGLDSEAAMPALEGALDDPDATVRAAAAQALAR